MDIYKRLEEKGYYALDKIDKARCAKYNLIDKDGYKYYVLIESILYHDKYPWKFHKNNPYTIDNIKNYIKLNCNDIELLSNNYIDNRTKMKFKCKCGCIFERTWMQVQKGTYYCNNCLLKKNSLTEEEIKNRINKLGFIFDKYYSHDVAEFHDANGYKFKRNISANSNSSFDKFNKNNPFTIDNINNYIKLNNIKSKLLSNIYEGNNIDMDWQCECGNIFKATWNNFLQGRIICHDCVIKNIKEKINKKNKDKIIKLGYIPLFDYIENFSNEKIIIKDKTNYIYHCWFFDLIQGKIPEKFGLSNKYTIYNINVYLELNNRFDYRCISDFSEYKGNNKDLRFIHIPCKTEFYASLVEMQGKTLNKNKYYKQCPTCNKNKTESIHASVLKQVFLKELLGTVCEDKSCRNPKTNYILPTDIVNHNLKIVIEIQSGFHDKERQKEKDEIKKNFWINKGYDFFAIDIRDYTILEMIQIFFPYIKEIPKYINYNFSNCIDFNEVQKYLDYGYSIAEIAKKLNIKPSSINGLINRKVICLPDSYYKNILHRNPIVRLDKNGNYIETFKTKSEANKKGFKSGTVNRVLKGIQKYSYESIWLYEDDYLLKNYTI